MWILRRSLSDITAGEAGKKLNEKHWGFLDGESDSKREREPRGCKYTKNPANHHDVLGEF